MDQPNKCSICKRPASPNTLYCQIHGALTCVVIDCNEKKTHKSGIFCSRHEPVMMDIYTRYKKLESGIKPYIGNLPTNNKLKDKQIFELISKTSQIIQLRKQHINNFKEELRCQTHLGRINALIKFQGHALKLYSRKHKCVNCGHDIIPTVIYCEKHRRKKIIRCEYNKCQFYKVNGSVYCTVHDTSKCAAKDCDSNRSSGKIYCDHHINYFFGIFQQSNNLTASIQCYLDDITLLDDLSGDRLMGIQSTTNQIIMLRNQIHSEGWKEPFCVVDKLCNALETFSDGVTKYIYQKLKNDYPGIECQYIDPQLMYTFLQNKNFYNVPDIYCVGNESDIISALSIFGKDEWYLIYTLFLKQTYCPEILVLNTILNYPLIGPFIQGIFEEKFYLPESITRKYLDKLARKAFFSGYPHVMDLWKNNERIYGPHILVNINDVKLVKQYIGMSIDKEKTIKRIAVECVCADNLDIWMMLEELTKDLVDVLFSNDFQFDCYHKVKDRQCMDNRLLLYNLVTKPTMLTYLMSKHQETLASAGINGYHHGSLLYRAIKLGSMDAVKEIANYGFNDTDLSMTDIHIGPSPIKLAVKLNDVSLYKYLIGAVLNPIYDEFVQMLINIDVSDEIFGVTLDFLIDRGFNCEYMGRPCVCKECGRAY